MFGNSQATAAELLRVVSRLNLFDLGQDTEGPICNLWQSLEERAEALIVKESGQTLKNAEVSLEDLLNALAKLHAYGIGESADSSEQIQLRKQLTHGRDISNRGTLRLPDGRLPRGDTRTNLPSRG